jgi:hypothetical protein
LNVLKILASQVETELLEALLQPAESTYPWNPTDPNTEAYWQSWNKDLSLMGGWMRKLQLDRDRCMPKFDECWVRDTAVAVATESGAVSIRAKIAERFASSVPQEWLDTIFSKAQDVVSSQLSLTDKMVQCVQDLLPEWGEDVLQVWARPLAFSMREAEVRNVRQVDWSELSQTEQARLSLAIAHDAINEFNKLTAQSEQ